jgi:hypothetical protein
MTMKTMVKRLDPRRMILNLTLAFTLLALSGMLQSAQARVALSMGVSTPQLSVHLKTGPRVQAKVLLTRRAGVRVVRARRSRQGVVTVRCTRAIGAAGHHGAGFALSRQDRQIARRLSRLSGHSRHEIVQLRRMGQSWTQVAFELRISRRQLVIAQNLALRLD